MKGLSRIVLATLAVAALLLPLMCATLTHACDGLSQLNAHHQTHALHEDLAQALNDACDAHAYVDHRQRLFVASYDVQALRLANHHAAQQLQQLKRQQLKAAQLQAQHDRQQLRLQARAHRPQPLRATARALTPRGFCR